MEKKKFEDVAGKSPDTLNKYEKVIIVAKRARQIAAHTRDSFCRELEKMGIIDDDQDQIINTDGWQEALAKSYERGSKPIVKAIKDLEEGKISYSYFNPDKA